MIKIKKNTTLNLLKEDKYIFLQNILKNNVICIISKTETKTSFFNQQLFNSLNNITSIFLLGF
jgi:hypothetical protein